MSEPFYSRRPWRTNDEKLLRELYGTMPLQRIADKLGRTYCSVQQRAIRLKLSTLAGTKHRWSDVDHALLAAELRRLVADVAARTGATPGAVLARIHRDGRGWIGAMR